jgi:hypothetical protein
MVSVDDIQGLIINIQFFPHRIKNPYKIKWKLAS